MFDQRWDTTQLMHVLAARIQEGVLSKVLQANNYGQTMAVDMF
jgi:hypothetical protein